MAEGLHHDSRWDALGEHQAVDDTGAAYDVQQAIDALNWKTPLASSGAPHQYTVLGREGSRTAWDILAVAIAQHPDAFMAFHRGYRKPQRYWEFRGWRFWRTSSRGAHGGVTAMLNRGRIEDDTPRRVDQGAGPIAWDGPPWLPNGSPWPSGWVQEPGSDRGGGRHGDWVYRPHLDVRRDYRCEQCGAPFYWDACRPCPRCGTPAAEVV